jgi:hypothetical protein
MAYLDVWTVYQLFEPAADFGVVGVRVGSFPLARTDRFLTG